MTSSTTTPAAPPDDDPRWLRVHPRSALVPTLGAAGTGLVLWLRVLRSAIDDEGSVGAALREPALWVVAAVILVVVCMVGAVCWVDTRRRSFVVVDEVLHVRAGRLTVVRTSIRLDRVQAVDVSLPVLARVLGLVRLVVRPGDGGSSIAAHLLPGDAQDLRVRLLGPDRAAEQGTTVVVVPRARARRAVRRDVRVWGGAVVVAVLAVATVVTAFVSVFGVSPIKVLLLLVGALVGLGSATLRPLERAAGFRLACDDGLAHIAYGIVNRERRTLRCSRVQGLTFAQGLWWRAPGWWAVTADLSGVDDDAQDDDEAASGVTIVPIATCDEGLRAAAAVLPALRGPALAELLAAPWGAAASQASHAARVVRPPARAWWLAPIRSRRHALVLDDAALVVAAGGLLRRTVVVAVDARTEAVGLRQGWVQRRLRLATVTLHGPGRAATNLVHLDAADAHRVLRTVAGRAVAPVVRAATVGRPGDAARI